MNRLANRISDYLIGLGLDASKKEIYTYAIEGLLNSIFIFGSILAIGAALHKFHIALIWMLFFLPVRHTTGGIHANSHLMCYIVSLSVGVCSILAADSIAKISWMLYAGLAFSLLIVFLFAPVIHPNHPLSQERIASIRKKARIIICTECCALLGIGFASFIPKSIIAAALLGVLSATISTFIGYLAATFIHRQ